MDMFVRTCRLWGATLALSLALACGGSPIEGSGTGSAGADTTGEDESGSSSSAMTSSATSEAGTDGSTGAVTTTTSDATTVGPGPGTTDPATTTTTTTTEDPATSVEPSTTSLDPSSTGAPDCAPEDEQEWFLDEDGDGYGVDGETVLDCEQPDGYVDQGGDCDDSDPARSPGLEELCDGQDNDCDPQVDEYSPSNTECEGCTLGEFEGSHYWLCASSLSWDNSRAACMDLGGGVDLAIISSQGEQDYIAGLVTGVGDHVWLGASDAAQEGAWLWIDGSDLMGGFESWQGQNPDNMMNSDCLAARSNEGNWDDRKCSNTNFRLCELPG